VSEETVKQMQEDRKGGAERFFIVRQSDETVGNGQTLNTST